MLTREAWNALLKILEEPPPRVIFVFATTEPQKIQQSAAPILSRCQRFDFRRIGVADIIAQLTRVLAEEKTDAPEDALRVIARKADGGMRDALSLLDQVLSLTGGSVDLVSVRRVLGLVEEERYFELLDILRDDQHDRVFTLVQQLVDEGYDLVEFYHGLLDVLRMLLRLRLSPEADVDLQPVMRAQLLERASAFEPGDLVRMLSDASDLESQGSLRRSPNPRLPIEMLLLRMSFLDRTVGLEELIGALGGAPRPSGGAGSSGSGPATPGSGGSGPARGTPSGVTTDGAKAGAGEQNAFSASSADAAPGRSAAPPAAPAARPDLASDEPEVADPPAAIAPIVPVDDVEEAWRLWLHAGRGLPKGLTAFLRSSSVRDGGNGRVAIIPLAGPAAERIAQPTVLSAIAEGLAPYMGRRPKLTVEEAEVSTDPPVRVTPDEVRNDTLKALYRQEPRLERAVQELDLELMD